MNDFTEVSEEDMGEMMQEAILDNEAIDREIARKTPKSNAIKVVIPRPGGDLRIFKSEHR